jgi:DNA polymerase-1
MKENTFRDIVNKKTKIVYKTKAKQCPSCKGHGKYRKTKKDGTPFANETKCPTCLATGFLFDNTNEVAGLKFKAPNAKWASANGFTTSKINIAVLERISKEKGMDTAYSFLSKVRRLSAVETYLSSFIDGISSHIKQDGMLHVKLLQHRTSTGRLSGANPNMQNMPRGGTFPVKKVFVSRWEGGKILEADFAQLEFRVAAFLSQDETAIKEIKEGFDVHSYTAKVITDAGQPTSRQDSKQHTFAPLYGATGFGRTKAEATYYERFIEKYKGVASWHGRLAQQALDTSTIKIPSGREFRFNNVYRLKNNSITNFTQIKNYPVQSFATADCVLLCLVYMDKLLKDKQSCIVNTVHDSIVIDIHPGEIDEVIQVINDTNSNLKSLIDNKWNIDFNVPLLLEAKIGNNWLDTKDIL